MQCLIKKKKKILLLTIISKYLYFYICSIKSSINGSSSGFINIIEIICKICELVHDISCLIDVRIWVYLSKLVGILSDELVSAI